jgi:hypothetical protein
MLVNQSFTRERVNELNFGPRLTSAQRSALLNRPPRVRVTLHLRQRHCAS